MIDLSSPAEVKYRVRLCDGQENRIPFDQRCTSRGLWSFPIARDAEILAVNEACAQRDLSWQ